MNYNSLKSDIAAVVRENGNQEITGDNLQGVLTEMIDNSVGTGYLYKGIATPETQSGTPDQNVFYLAGAGTYANFGTTIVIPDGSIGVFAYNGTWTNTTLIITSANAVSYNEQTPTTAQQKQAQNNIGITNILQNCAKLSSSVGNDFYITDANGNVVFKISDGHIVSKKFNSATADAVRIASNDNFYITDMNGNAVLTVTNTGHIKTKMFDSSNISNKKKNTFSILGDSWSAIKDFVHPSTNAFWYPTSDPDAQGYGQINDVGTYADMWWYKFAYNYNIRLVCNNSWSGSKIAKSTNSCFLNRVDDIGDVPELIIVLGTRNDDNNSELGDYKYSDWTENDLTYYRPACAKLLSDLQTMYIGATILFACNSANADKIASAQEICSHYNVPYLQLTLTSAQLGGNHPNKAGMEYISSNIINKLNSL